MLAGKMRLSDFCNRLSTRAPCTLPDSRSRSLRAPQPSTPRGASDHRPLRFANTGGASLDGDSPASASPQPLGRLAEPKPRSSPESSTAQTWESLDRELLRAVPPDCGLVDRAPSMVAWPLASFSTTAPLDPIFRSDPRRPPLGSASAAVSSKTAASSQPGHLPSTSALSPAPPGPVHRLRSHRTQASQDHREPATVPTTLPPRAGFEHRLRPSSSHEASLA